MRQGIRVAGIGIALVLAGCSGEVEPEVVTRTVTAEAATVTETTTATETVTVEPTEEPVTWSRQAATEGVREAMRTVWDDTDDAGREALCTATGLDAGWAAEEIGGDWADRFPELPRDDFLAVIEDFLVAACP